MQSYGTRSPSDLRRATSRRARPDLSAGACCDAPDFRMYSILRVPRAADCGLRSSLRWRRRGEGEPRNKWFFGGCSDPQASSFPASPTSTTTASRLPLVGVGTPDFSKRRRLFVCIQQRHSDGSPAPVIPSTARSTTHRGTRRPRGSITRACLASVHHHLVMRRPAAQVSRRTRDALVVLGLRGSCMSSSHCHGRPMTRRR